VVRIELLCPSCGAADITRDACARWNAETGDWELSATYDTMTCDACGDETYECSEVDLDTLPEEDTDEWHALAKAAVEKVGKYGRGMATTAEKYLAWAYVEFGYSEKSKDPC
jgi:predicted RNA-binding Zn-ribbon protein involved in translation (DUF1610 family)